LQGVMLTALYVRNIVQPLSNLSGFSLAVNIIFLFAPLLVESILLLRLVAVFPSRIHGRRTLFLILIFPITVRIGRLVNMCVAIARLTASSSTLQNNVAQWWALLPYIRVEWSLALVDNAYVSLVFLYRLKTRVPSISHQKTNVMAARVRRLFFIASSNFLIPGLLNIVQLVLIFVLPNHSDSEARQTQLFLICAYIMIVFNYVCIIGVVFATIWSTGSSQGSGWTTMSNASVPPSMAASPAPDRLSFKSGGFRGSTDNRRSGGFRGSTDNRPSGGFRGSTDNRPSVDNLSVPLIGTESSSSEWEGEKPCIPESQT